MSNGTHNLGVGADEIARQNTQPFLVTTVTAYNLPPDAFEVIFEPAAAATPFVVNLPPARTVEGRTYVLRIRGTNAATSTATITPSSLDSDAGAGIATPVIDTAGDYIILQAIGGQFVIHGGVYTP